MKRIKNKIFYGVKKLIAFTFSILILSIVVFGMSRMTPIDPLQSYYGTRAEKMSEEDKEAARKRLGLNDPIYVQYIRWAESAIRGDFGISYKYKEDVLTVIGKRIGNTLILGGIGFLLTFLFALLLGLLCAWKEDGLADRIICKFGTITSCIPEFWFSLVLILVFCVGLRLLPSSGAYSVGKEHDAADRIRHLILPMLVVLSSHIWYYAYMIRNRLIEEMRADYVLLGRAVGLKKREIMLGHCLRNIMPFFLSLMAVSISHILGGTYIVETVFSYPGLGSLSYESARYADYNMLMVLCLLTGMVVIFSNMLAQIINEHIDPRIRAEQTEGGLEEAGYDR